MTTYHGAPVDEMPGIGALTLGTFLEDVASRFGDAEALVFDEQIEGAGTVRWSYADLLHESRRVAKAFIAAGLGKGMRVAVLMGNRPEAVAGLFGAAMAGAVVVPLSTFSPKPELAFLLAHSDASVLLTQTALRDRRLAGDVADLCGEATGSADGTLRSVTFPFLRRVVTVDPDPASAAQPWGTFLAMADDVDDAVLDACVAQVTPSDLGVAIYSSGTTSTPKGMLHNHRSPTLQFWVQAQIFGRHRGTRLWTAFPMFWTAGMNTAMGATLAAGGCWVMQETFEPGEALALMARERVTEPYCLPHQTAALEEHPDWASTDLSSLRSVFGKSAFARHPSVEGDPTWNMPVGYGLSETCAFFAAHWSDRPRALAEQSMGRLLPGNQLRVVDPDTDRVLGPGEDGELIVKGPTLMEHYVKRTREECFDDDGFFHTGDMGFVDEHGDLRWTGRRTEMIKTGGANVSPAEIEVALRACAPVKLARVIGLPDPLLGQVVVLCVTLKEGATATEESITAFLRERVASYKVPRRVLLFPEGEIPMTRSDTKVKDAELSALVERRLRDTSEPSPTVPNRSKR